MQLVLDSPPVSGADSAVHAIYDDVQIVPMTTLPANSVLLRFIQSQYVSGPWPPMLSSTWVNDLTNVVAQEAARRVEQCYTASQQRAAALIVQDNMIQYGTDPGTWPAAAQTQYTEIQRGLAYINSVNAAQQTIITQGVLNVCDDQYWPAPITPISL
jgi:hypothetical protein